MVYFETWDTHQILGWFCKESVSTNLHNCQNSRNSFFLGRTLEVIEVDVPKTEDSNKNLDLYLSGMWLDENLRKDTKNTYV